MPSRASADYSAARGKALLLVEASKQTPLAGSASTHRAACLHAALAMLVAAWEAYLERLVRESQQKVSDPLNARLTGTLGLLQRLSENEIKRFNTPNADNARTLLLEHTGYDPINDWEHKRMKLNGLQTRTRLNEILLVRHSFAHGFPIPTAITWARTRNVPGTLSVKILSSVDSVLTHLVRVTDREMSNHLNQVFGIAKPW